MSSPPLSLPPLSSPLLSSHSSNTLITATSLQASTQRNGLEEDQVLCLLQSSPLKPKPAAAHCNNHVTSHKSKPDMEYVQQELHLARAHAKSHRAVESLAKARAHEGLLYASIMHKRAQQAYKRARKAERTVGRLHADLRDHGVVEGSQPELVLRDVQAFVNADSYDLPLEFKMEGVNWDSNSKDSTWEPNGEAEGDGEND